MRVGTAPGSGPIYQTKNRDGLMRNTHDLTRGGVAKTLVRFALPYLLSCFLQTFYGLTDLFVVGLYNTKQVTAAVSTGSQVTHMLTVMIVGLAMGVTVHCANAAGAENTALAKRVFSTAVTFFSVLAIVVTLGTLALAKPITMVMKTPSQSVEDTVSYLRICFLGVPFIIVFNVISALFRGFGDSRRPMFFVGAACFVNIVFDFVFVGAAGLGAAGAALATVLGQASSAVFAVISYTRSDLGFHLDRSSLRPDRISLLKLLRVGVPISLQDGLIQIAFTVIIVIANSRGLVFSSSVGIVEKLIGFMFLVPSSFLSAISAVTAQNLGAGKPRRARRSLYCGIAVTVSWGVICAVCGNLFPQQLVSLFTKDSAVIAAGSLYLMSYSFDCIFAAVHFCFSGYFCGCGRSVISFIHNIISIVLIRIPGAVAASALYPDTLYPMGWAAPLGSLLSALICLGFFIYYYHRERKNEV